MEKFQVSCINTLPEELFVEVLARVASSSFIDLFNAKLSCKDFNGASKYNYIFEHVSIDKFPRIPWKSNEKSSSFLKRCRESGNAEALYREGMIEFFSTVRLESGLINLKKAADKGHAEATYIYGIVLLCTNNVQKGLKVMSCLKKNSRTRGLKINECRKRIREFIWSMWVNKKLVPRQQSTCCQTKDHTYRRRGGWESSDEEEDDDNNVSANNGGICEYCKWNREVTRFCSMLRSGRSLD